MSRSSPRMHTSVLLLRGDAWPKDSRFFRVLLNQGGATVADSTRHGVRALPGFVWVEVEATAVEVDGRLEVLGVAEPAGRLLDPLDDGVEALEAGVGQAMA